MEASNELPVKEIYLGDWKLEETMYDALPELLYLRDLKEQWVKRREDEGGSNL